MKAYLAIWHDAVCVYVPEPLGRLLITLDRAENRFLLEVDPKVGGVFAQPATPAEVAAGYEWRYVFKSPRTDGFARCSPHPVVLSAAGTIGWEVVGLPANHDLPWPEPRDCDKYARDLELYGECLARRDSAMRVGVRMPAPPKRVQMALTADMRLRLFA